MPGQVLGAIPGEEKKKKKKKKQEVLGAIPGSEPKKKKAKMSGGAMNLGRELIAALVDFLCAGMRSHQLPMFYLRRTHQILLSMLRTCPTLFHGRPIAPPKVQEWDEKDVYAQRNATHQDRVSQKVHVQHKGQMFGQKK